MTEARGDLLRERVKLSAWVPEQPVTGNAIETPLFGPRYCIWLIDRALEAVRSQDMKIAQLTAENDQLNAREVIMVPNGHHLEVQMMDAAYAEGTIMRDMGTGREWVFSDGRWEDQR